MTRRGLLLGAGMALLGMSAGYMAARYRFSRPDHVRSAFHLLYHSLGAATYNDTHWRGVPVQKLPSDMWVYQEILHERQPDVLVEAGTFKGGSSYYFASLFDMLGKGRVISIDIEDLPNKPRHPRITYLLGSSTAPETLEKVKALIQPGERVMVSLDSDHHKDHVLRELRMYSPLVTSGQYLVVEDTHFNGHPILPKHGPGPFEAVQEFLRARPPFAIDKTREKFLMSFNASGYLRRD